MRAQARTDGEGLDGLEQRYPKVVARDFDGQPDRLTEMDALIAYLQMLGTLVNVDAYKAGSEGR
jgi:cytochrome c oxidase cbb3-type subunit 2